MGGNPQASQEKKETGNPDRFNDCKGVGGTTTTLKRSRKTLLVVCSA